nr:uncharacterized protein LOC129387916 [Dermacentor andersoni]
MTRFLSTCHCSDIKTSTTTTDDDTFQHVENRSWRTAYLEALRRSRKHHLPRDVGSGCRSVQQIHSRSKTSHMMLAADKDITECNESNVVPEAALTEAGLSSDYVTARATSRRQSYVEKKGQYGTSQGSLEAKAAHESRGFFVGAPPHKFTFYSLLVACFVTVLVYVYFVIQSSSDRPQAGNVATQPTNGTTLILHTFEPS